MGNLTLSPPPRFQGSPNQQMQACYTYLYKMQEQLNTALQRMDSGSVTLAGGQKEAPPAQVKADSTQFESLRALIVKNATLVQREMDRLQTELHGSYVAQSEFGTYLQNISAIIEADPAAVSQYYSFLDGIRSELHTGLEEAGKALEEYSRGVEGCIRSGTVDYTAEGEPIFGVAVGQNLTEAEVTVDGEIKRKITNRFRSVFTAQELAFWQNDSKVAWLSSQSDSLHIGTADISLLCLGPWEMGYQEGFYIKWIGG